MPYRRLPNTDEARVRSLKQAIEQQNITFINDLPFSSKSLQEANVFLLSFERARYTYKQAFQEQVNASKSYQELIKQAKLYISHFIQVLNLSIIRKEIRPESKLLYGLDPESHSVPELLNDTALLEWGEKVIDGEEKRISKGGTPIYSPAVAKVKVHYDMFKDAYYRQKVYQQNTARSLEALSELRAQGDQIILDIWNQVEESFNGFPTEERLQYCRKYGIIYYYRKGEKRYELD